MTGLARFTLFPEKPMHHIAFSFHKSMKGAQKGFARDIHNIFIHVMRKSFGGFIQRIESDDAMSGSYEVHIWTRAVNSGDPSLEPLWDFITNLLGVNATTIQMGQGVPAEDRFRDRFFLSVHHVEPEDWTTGFDLTDDTASAISFDSIHFP